MLVFKALVVLRVLLFPPHFDRKVILESPARLRGKAFCFDTYAIFDDIRKAIVMQQDPIQHQCASPAIGSTGSQAWQRGIGPL
jgi:hypothetical protein